MLIDRKQPICGVRPAMLKKLLRRDRFSTLTAMEDLELPEPEISRSLAELEAEGWIRHAGTERYVDQWEATEQGDRLSATRLIKRFPIREGRAIVERIVAEARAINADPMGLRRVTEIVLFGSVLTGPDDGDAGDIDLVVNVHPRTLGPADRTRLEAAEAAAMPDHLNFFQRLCWGDTQILRRIKRVSNKITLHSPSDLVATGTPHRTVYVYDLERECELPADPTIKAHDKPERAGKGEIARRTSRATYRDSWPVAPNEPALLSHADSGTLRLAQHMWQRGASALAIARRTGIPRKCVEAYLASRRGVSPLPPLVFDASLFATAAQALRPGRHHTISVHVEVTPRGQLSVETTIYTLQQSYEELLSIRGSSRREQHVCGRCDLLPAAEPVSDAAWFWLQRMRDRLRGVGLELWVSLRPEDGPQALTHPAPMDLRPLGPPLLDVLETQLPRPRSRYTAWDHRLEVKLGQRIELHYWDGTPWTERFKPVRITKPNALSAWRAVKEFNERYAAVLPRGSYTVYVNGQQLEDRGRASGDVVETRIEDDEFA